MSSRLRGNHRTRRRFQADEWKVAMVRLSWKAAFGLVLALAALLSGTSLTSLAAAQSGSWTVTSSPNQGTRGNQLNGIAAASSSAIWSVGSSNAGPYTNSLRTLIESWKGTA